MSEDKTPPEGIDSTKTGEESSTPPNRIGNHRTLEKIGKGGMGPRTLAACQKFKAVYLHAAPMFHMADFAGSMGATMSCACCSPSSCSRSSR